MVLREDEILEALKGVYDPEIPVDIVNLGLIYEIRVAADIIYVKITTTAPGCPVGNYIIHGLAEADGEGSPEIIVETVYDPPWGMGRVSEKGRRMLGWQ